MARRQATTWLLALVIGGVALLIALGASPRDAFALTAAILVQGVTGAVAWQLIVRPRRVGLVEATGVGLAIGSALAALSGVVLGALTPWAWWWLAPTVVIGAIAIARRGVRFDATAAGVGAAALGIALGLVGLVANLVRYPLAGGPQYHEDLVFFEALGRSVAGYGPSDSVFMAGNPIRYHWLAYAWAGQLTDATGAAPFTSLTRALPLVALLATVGIAVAWARRLSTSRAVPFLAAVLVAAGGYVGAANGTILNFDSPSQALTTAWLMALALALLAVVDGSRSALAIGVVLLIALTAGKASAGVVGLAGVGAVALVGLARREPWARRASLLALVGSLAVGATVLLVLAGSASSGDLRVLELLSRASTVQGLNSSPGARGIVIGTLVLVAAMAARWSGTAWLIADPRWRWRPDVVLGVAMGAVGVVAVLVLSQGVNETWFALSASAPLSVLSAVGIGLAWQRASSRRGLAIAIIGGLLITPLIAVLWARGWPGFYIIRFWAPVTAFALALLIGCIVASTMSTRRFAAGAAAFATALLVASCCARALPVLSSAWTAQVGRPSASDPVEPATGDMIVAAPRPESEFDPQSAGSPGDTASEAPATPDAPVIAVPRGRVGWTADDAAAADFLRAAADRGDVIVTNESVSYVVPALTGLRTYLSGAPYQDLYGAKGDVDEIPARLETSMRFTSAPDSATRDALCDAGVRWAWIANDLPHPQTWEPYGEAVFRNDAVTIVTLACRS